MDDVAIGLLDFILSYERILCKNRHNKIVVPVSCLMCTAIYSEAVVVSFVGKTFSANANAME